MRYVSNEKFWHRFLSKLTVPEEYSQQEHDRKSAAIDFTHQCLSYTFSAVFVPIRPLCPSR